MGRGKSMTVQGLCVLLCLLSSADYVSSSVVFHKPGDTARIKCLCSRAQGCYNELIRWVRINSNGSLQIIDAKCDKPPCNFTSTEVNNTHVELKITHVKPEDSGRYYCGEHLASYLQFNGIGVALQVGVKGMVPDRPYETEDSVELRCVVTGLSTPWVNVIWKSSTGEKVETNKTWSLTEASRGYRVESRLRIVVMPQETDKKLDKTLNKTVEIQDEWWCEVQVGVNSFLISQNVSFLQEIHTSPGWCVGMLYTGIVLSALCMCLLILFTCHYLFSQRKGSALPATEASQTSNSHRDVYSGVTYAQLDIKGQPKTDRQQRHKDRQADKMVYSEVRSKVNSQSDVYSGVTYAKLDIKGQPRTDRRQRQKDRQADRMVYSEVRSKPNNGQP